MNQDSTGNRLADLCADIIGASFGILARCFILSVLGIAFLRRCCRNKRTE